MPADREDVMAELGRKRTSGRERVEADARPQFEKSRHGVRNDGTSSAEPRSLTRQSDGDSTFDDDPDEGARRARRADMNRQSPAREP